MIKRFFKKEFWIGLMAMGMACAFNVILAVSGLTELSPKYKEAAEAFSSLPVWQLAFLALIIAPILEELIFRGTFFGLPRYVIKLITGSGSMTITLVFAMISAILFGVYHGNIVQGIYAFLMGLGMCYAYETCGGLLWSMSFHFFANFFSLFAGGLILDAPLLRQLMCMAVGFGVAAAAGAALREVYLERIAASVVMIKEEQEDGEEPEE